MTSSVRRSVSRLARVNAALTDGDRIVLQTLAALRLATTSQLQRLHFTAGTTSANLRAAQRALGKLAALGVVTRLERRIGGVRAGSAGQVYGLGTAGQHLVTGHGPAGGRQIRRPWTPSLPFVSHRLAITELDVRLVEAERRGELELVSFTAEPEAWRRYLGPHGATAWLKPDAFVVVGAGDYEDRWFVEVDLGTESPLVIARKCRAYLDYQSSGREQAETGVFPLVLFIVPSERRRRTILGVTKRQPTTAGRLFRVTTDDAAIQTIAGGAA